jgi:hypothetical protein
VADAEEDDADDDDDTGEAAVAANLSSTPRSVPPRAPSAAARATRGPRNRAGPRRPTRRASDDAREHDGEAARSPLARDDAGVMSARGREAAAAADAHPAGPAIDLEPGGENDARGGMRGEWSAPRAPPGGATAIDCGFSRPGIFDLSSRDFSESHWLGALRAPTSRSEEGDPRKIDRR